MKLFGKIIKAVLTVLVFAVIGAFIFRIIIANAEYVLDEITPTENAMNAYEKLGEDAFMTNRIDDTISGKEDGADGYYSAFSFIYIPEYGEVQVTARVNDEHSRPSRSRKASSFLPQKLRDRRNMGLRFLRGRTQPDVRIPQDGVRRHQHNRGFGHTALHVLGRIGCSGKRACNTLP